jgi:pilus assembly protein CpaC
VESENKGLPWASEVPYLGALFRRVQHENNEIELLILVTPELVEAIEAHEAPPCGPGTRTTDPDDWDLYMRGHLEVPTCCPSCGTADGACEHGVQTGLIGGWGDGASPDGALPPSVGQPVETAPQGPNLAPPGPPPANGSSNVHGGAAVQSAYRHPTYPPQPNQTASRPRSAYTRSNSRPDFNASRTAGGAPGPVFIGPIGYDVLK